MRFGPSAGRAIVVVALVISAGAACLPLLLPSRPEVQPWTEELIAESMRRGDVLAGRVATYRAEKGVWPQRLAELQEGVGLPVAGEAEWTLVIDSPERARLSFSDTRGYELCACQKEVRADGTCGAWRRW